jgi:hypothetical protein
MLIQVSKFAGDVYSLQEYRLLYKWENIIFDGQDL